MMSLLGHRRNVKVNNYLLDLFGKLADKDGKNEKRGMHYLMHDLIQIQKAFGRFSDGKLDCKYLLVQEIEDKM